LTLDVKVLNFRQVFQRNVSISSLCEEHSKRMAICKRKKLSFVVSRFGYQT